MWVRPWGGRGAGGAGSLAIRMLNLLVREMPVVLLTQLDT